MSQGVTINGKTRLVGVLGWPVSHSRSPAMHNPALAAAGINAAYVPLAVEPARIADAVRGLQAMGFVGCNVTIPHKVAVAALMDRLTPPAKVIGAVNTIRVEPDGSLTGHNADCEGATRAIEADGTAIAGKSVVIVGAGGAGRGVAVGCAMAGAARVVILNRTREKAEEIVAALRGSPELPRGTAWEAHALADEGRAVPVDWKGVGVVIQVTSVGMNEEGRSPLDVGLLPPQCHVLESIYSPLETSFLRNCRLKGLRTSDGLSMLLEQGAASFEYWFGMKPDRALMRAALRSAG